jgi:hypothetical protein
MPPQPACTKAGRRRLEGGLCNATIATTSLHKSGKKADPNCGCYQSATSGLWVHASCRPAQTPARGPCGARVRNSRPQTPVATSAAGVTRLREIPIEQNPRVLLLPVCLR